MSATVAAILAIAIVAVVGALTAAAIALAVRAERARIRGDMAETEAEAKRATRQRMDDATRDLDDDPAVLREWLRARGNQRPGDL